MVSVSTKIFSSVLANTVSSSMDLNISRPTLLLDISKVKANLNNMMNKAQSNKVELIPHFKTHQSEEIGEFYREVGVEKITVSSVKMAEFFAEAGWNDITIAFPFNTLEIDAVNSMLNDGVNLTLLISDPETYNSLKGKFVSMVQVMIEIDTGYGRSGISSRAVESILGLAEKIHEDSHLKLYGLYAHPGNTYHADSIEEIHQIWSLSIEELNILRDELNAINPELKIRIGDTPGCSVVQNMAGVDEIGPGNFIFYDLVMNYLGVCNEDEIAVAVACPVVAKYAERSEIVIHGGAVHFSKDHLFDKEENKFFGEMVILKDGGWSSIIPNAQLRSLSQEHGIVSLDDEVFNEVKIGDVIGFLPIHSCLTTNLMKSYRSLEGRTYNHLENLK